MTNNSTKTVRLTTHVADLAKKIAPHFGETVPVFLSKTLEPILENLQKKVATRSIKGTKLGR